MSDSNQPWRRPVEIPHLPPLPRAQRSTGDQQRTSPRTDDSRPPGPHPRSVMS